MYVHQASFGGWAFSTTYGTHYNSTVDDWLQFGDKMVVVDYTIHQGVNKYYFFHERLQLYTQMWPHEIDKHLKTNKPFVFNHFFLCLFNVGWDFAIILNPSEHITRSQKQQAAIFGIINALCVRMMYDRAWPQKDKKKPPQS